MESELAEILIKLRSSLLENDLEGALAIIEELHPADQADLVTKLKTDNQIKILTNLEPSESADVLEEMEDDVAASVAELLTPSQLAGILNEMESDEAADVLGDLPLEVTNKALEQMQEPEEIIPLLKYPDDTAGGLMTTAVITLKPDWTVDKTLKELREIGPHSDSTYYLFVTDNDSKLIGVVGLRSLVSAQKNQTIQELMEPNIISVQALIDQEECARTLSHYGYLALPVVDESERFLGVITADDLIEVVEEEATEDMLRMVGIRGEDTVFSPIRISIVKRLPWLAINIITLFIAVSVIDAFESIIAELVLLAVFLPIVSGEGGNAGSQTATVIVRGLALGELDVVDGRKALLKELAVTFVNGAIIGLSTGLLSFIWKKDLIIAVAICLAMIFNFIMAALTGVLIPLGLKKINVDPALASAAFITGFTDTFGFLFFLGLASLLL